MKSEPLPRKLAAILYADVVGYSRLTGEDEDATHRRLTEYLDQIALAVERHRGRVMHYAGDAVLAMFEAVVDALACAAHVQNELRIRNDDLADERKVQFRIGVNLGDVIEDRGDIYGDGVNVAARLESLGEPGGICISESVHTAVGNKLPFDYEFLGEQEVKNIAKPVKAYHARLKPDAVLPEPTGAPSRGKPMRRPAVAAVVVVLVVVAGVVGWLRPWQTREEPASVERMAFALPDKPSIAVLPFTNMSGDPKQEYFVDGMTEDLITDLSKVSGLFVIARNSTFTYKGKAVKVRQVAEDLGVRYVLEGSVRRVGGQVRINAQFIDATTGRHLWANRYDGSLEDVFALQDKVTRQIVSALAVKLTADENARQAREQTDNAEAYDAFLKGWAHYRKFTRKDFAKALDYLKLAVELDPNYARAHAAIAGVYTFAIVRGWDYKLRWCGRQSLAEKHLRLAMKNPTALTHRFASVLRSQQGRHEEAMAEAAQMIALDSNDAENYDALGYAFIWAGRPEEAIGAYRKAMRLDPHYPAQYSGRLGIAYFNSGDFAVAAETIAKARKRNPGLAAWVLAAAYGHLGRKEEAAATLKQYQKYRRYSKLPPVDAVVGFHPYRRRQDAGRLGAGLIKAGLCCEDKLDRYMATRQAGSKLFTPLADLPERFGESAGVTVLSGAEIRDEVIGNTVVSTARGKKWSEYYLTDGTLLGSFGDRRYCGYWKISGPAMCTSFGFGPKCRMVALEGKTITRFKPDGTPDPPGVLLTGKPDSL